MAGMQHRNKDKSRCQPSAPSRAGAHGGITANASITNDDGASHTSRGTSRQSHHQVSSSDERGGTDKRHESNGKTSTENSSESENDQGSGNSGSEEPITDSSQSRTAISDGTISTMELRKGKWTAEEEEFTTRVIHYFSSGLIALPEGKTLRSYLAEKLMCDPMRITKKYAGASCLGKRIHNLCESPRFSPQEIEMAKLEIDRLEERFRLRLIQGPGATLPPLPSAPVIHGSVGSFSTARDQGLGYYVSSTGKAVSNNGQQQQPAGSTPQVVSSSGGTSREQLGFNPPFPVDANNGISVAPAPPTQTSQTKSSQSYLNNNPAAAFLASLTNNPQIVASLSNNSDFAALLDAITQTTAPPPPPVAPVPPEPALSNSMTLEQILRQANLSASLSPPTVQQPLQGQEIQAPPAAVAGSRFLHPCGSNSTSAAQHQPPHAGLQTSFNSSNASDNDKLAHALLAHITTQLQELAATSPSTLQKVQQQLVQSSIASSPNLWAQVSPNNDMNDPSALLKTLQQLTSPRAPAPQTQSAGYPGTMQSSGFPIQSYQQATTQNSEFHALPSLQQQATSNQNSGRQDPAGLLEILSAQHKQQHAPVQSAAARNLQSLITAQQAAAADAANNAPLANAYNMFMSNVAAASGNPQNTTHVTGQNFMSSTSLQVQPGDLSEGDALSRAISNLIKESQGQSMVGSNTGMDELIDVLRKNHAKVSSQAQSNTEERTHNSHFSFHHAKHGRESPDSPWHKRSKLTGKEHTERSSVSKRETTNSTMIYESNQEGHIIKKRAKWASNRVGFHQSDDTANISSKSASSSQFDTEESKSTSSGDNPESDETKNNQTTSSNSSSDEGGDDHRVAVLMRKRFQ